MMETQYIYEDIKRNEKARLVRTGEDWYVCECKSISDKNAPWIPFISGTSEYLALSDLDHKWAIDKR